MGSIWWKNRNPDYKGTHGGLDNISDTIGAQLYLESILHDDGVIGHGGERVLTIGEMGSGKTTLALKSVPKMCYTPSIPKDNLINGEKSSVYPETVVWRGRKLDYWNCYLPENFRKCFPGVKPRELRVFVYCKDKTQFFEENPETGVGKPLENLDLKYYTTVEDLYNNLINGGINVVYVPEKYSLSPRLINLLNERTMAKEGGKTYLDPNDIVLVRKEAFWYELFYHLIELRYGQEARGDKIRIRWITFIFDEAHQVFPQGVPKPFWYLVDDFVENWLVETRRINFSIFAQTHALSLMYWKATQRFSYMIWLPGSRLSKKHTCLKNMSITAYLPKGKFIIEHKDRYKFGKSNFSRIPNQPFPVMARGIS